MVAPTRVCRVAVIGPEAEAVARVAQGIRGLRAQWKVAENVGPDWEPDAVLAAISAWDSTTIEVVRAVVMSRGRVVVLRESQRELEQPAPKGLPGVVEVDSLQMAIVQIEGCALDRRQWEADAARADAERNERINIAIRVEGNRLATELSRGGIHSKQEWEERMAEFVIGLHTQVLGQGVAIPQVGHVEADWPHVPRQTRWQELALISVACIGAIAAGLALGKAIGALWVGLAVGLMLAGVVGAVRWRAAQNAYRSRAAEHRGAAFRQAAIGYITSVVARMQIPRMREHIVQELTVRDVALQEASVRDVAVREMLLPDAASKTQQQH